MADQRELVGSRVLSGLCVVAVLWGMAAWALARWAYSDEHGASGGAW